MVSTQHNDLFQLDEQFVADALKIRYFPFAPVRGEGANLFDASGKRYIDFGSGWAVAGLGYTNAHVRKSVSEQMDRMTFATLLSGSNQQAVTLASRLARLVPGKIEKKVWFGLSGSDSSEAAQRMILRATGKPRIVSFVGAWHGTTDSAMALSAHPSLTVPSGAHVTKIPYPDPLRNPFGATSEDVVDKCLAYLEDFLFKTICPPDQVAAIFAEAVQSDGGDIVPPPDFLPKLRALCDRHDIYLVLDEIKIGLGRTGRTFGFDHAGIEPDFVLLGKSLGGGLPLSAVVGRLDVLDVDTGIALFTLSGNATSCAAGNAVLDEVERLRLAERSESLGATLLQTLKRDLAEFDCIGDVRGLGLILGVEVVEDSASMEPDQRLAAKIVYRAWQRGLIVYYAGNWGNVLEITPPLIIEESDALEGAEILKLAITEVLDGAVSDDEIAAFAGW